MKAIILNATAWMIVPVIGKTPGRRYGHAIISLSASSLPILYP